MNENLIFTSAEQGWPGGSYRVHCGTGRRELSGFLPLRGLQCLRMTLLFYDIQKISRVQDRVTRWDDGFAATADEYNQLVIQSKVREALSGPVMKSSETDLMHSAVFRVSAFRTTENQFITLEQPGITLWKNLFPAALDHRKDGTRRKRDIRDGFAGPGMLFYDSKLNKLYRKVFSGIVERCHDIFPRVNHVKPAGGCRDQCSLYQNGEQYEKENRVKQIIGQIRRPADSHDGKGDGGGTSHAGKGYKQDLARRAPKVRKSARRRAGPATDGSLEGYARRPSIKKSSICISPVRL